MKNKLLIIILVSITAAIAYVWRGNMSSEARYRIGIIQTASHPALDKARESFVAELEELTGGPISWVVQNAEGSMAQMATIARGYSLDSRMDAVYAIATPAVQMLDRIASEKPMLYAAVSNPDSLKLGEMACGTSDRVDVVAQAAMIREVLPEARRVAIMLNPAEHNSVIQVAAMERALNDAGLETVRVGCQAQGDIVAAASSASRQADLILVPADNLLVSAMPLLSKTALQHSCPLVVSDTPSVTRGALIARGVDYTDCGRQTAKVACQLLVEGKSPKELGTVHPENKLILLNTDTCASLGIDIPASMEARVTRVRTGGEIPCQ